MRCLGVACRLLDTAGYLLLLLVSVGATCQVQAAKLVEVSVLDKDFLIVHLSDGEVIHDEGSASETIIRYTPELNTGAAVQTGSWTLTSADDAAYGTVGQHPLSCYRKTKLNGHAQMEWSGSDYRYEYTYAHWIYLRLPSSLQQGMTYTLAIAPVVNSDDNAEPFNFDIYTSRSEAIHVNLVGYAPDAIHKAADLYHWMGSGGARDYSGFQGNTVWAYGVSSGQAHPVGNVSFWMANGTDVFGYNLTRSDVWNVDLSSITDPGTYRLVVEGVGCSQELEIAGDIYANPFLVLVRGYFYMRIGETNPDGLSPPPRTPLYIPELSPAPTRVYLTTMHPWHPEWDSFSSGDRWDRPNDWQDYVKPGSPTNPNAWGGHSDAADWDRHLAHVANIYDMLLPFLLTDGAISDDDLGITESGNGIPDILDEARNEVDFWLRLRDGDGYSHGLTNPNSSNHLFQAGPTAIAAWANAANAAMLADALRVAGLSSLMNHYRDQAVTAYSYADGLADPMLDEGLQLDDGLVRGRDLKMMAAAFLYNVTGSWAYENVIAAESVCAGGPAELMNAGRHQVWGTAAYLITPQTVHYPALQSNMKAQIIAEARSDEADLIDSRPSRRATDRGPASFWRTAHNMDRTIIAHAVADDPVDIAHFRKALDLEAGWGLGRNPLNMIEMTTATTPLASKRSVEEAYTSGWYDGIPGVHPGHTPYLNLSDWAAGMVMGRPSALYQGSYPGDVPSTWPRGETYFPSRWVWAHTEFTPRQTMRGKVALYGYLYGLSGATPPANPTLTVTSTGAAGGSGSVTSSPPGIDCGSDCGHAFANGTDVVLTASPASGSRFTGWSGACFGTLTTCAVTMTFNRSVTATFEPIGLTYMLTVTTSGNGNGAVTSSPPGISCGNDCSEPYLSATSVTLTAAADGDSTFIGWQGACSGTGACSVTMSAARSVTASFRSNTIVPVTVYDDTLATGWADWSWGEETTINLAGESPVRVGSRAVNATLDAWGAFSPAMASGAIDTFGYHAVKLWVHGGTGSNKLLRFFTEGGGGQSSIVDITAVASIWTPVTITLSELGNPASISRLNFMNYSNSAIGMVTFDQIRLESGLFEDDFESGDTSAWSMVTQ
jgi:hypothetical protein